jgi:hypothetical protein
MAARRVVILVPRGGCAVESRNPITRGGCAVETPTLRIRSTRSQAASNRTSFELVGGQPSHTSWHGGEPDKDGLVPETYSSDGLHDIQMSQGIVVSHMTWWLHGLDDDDGTHQHLSLHHITEITAKRCDLSSQEQSGITQLHAGSNHSLSSSSP